MWIFLFLYILALNISQASAQGNSTQMYYANMVVDKSLIEIIKQTLNFALNDTSLNIVDIQITTECSANGKCKCNSGHRWSDEVCAKTSCCDASKPYCDVKGFPAEVCILNTTVGVKGQLKIKDRNGDYSHCLTNQQTSSYKTCHQKLLTKMKEVYSLIKGFDSLEIMNFSVGSIIIDFGMKILSAVDPQILSSITESLIVKLEGQIVLETKGIVSLNVSTESVRYNSSTTMQCTTQEDLGDNPHWELKREDGVFDILNGVISTVIKGNKESTVRISAVDELWQGEYICQFVQENDNKTMIIKHKANATMDVCLLPRIEIYADPAFPLCIFESDNLYVKVKCVIKKSNENYTVRWDVSAIPEELTKDGDKEIHNAIKVVRCQESAGNIFKDTSCSFENQCHQIQNQSMSIEIIYVGQKYCVAQGEWANTKATFTAEIKCPTEAGTRKRKCNIEGVWEEPVSKCVDQQLHSVLEDAKISDIGLGELSKNAANVLHQFENVTRSSKLPGYANIDTSVQVLKTLDDKLKQINLTNSTAIQDFLQSSSHLMNESLASSWNQTPPADSTVGLAATYMLSVENLIKISNISNNIRKEKLEVIGCNTSLQCNLTVFNVNISFPQLPSVEIVKTAGFKQLEKYLPYNESKSEPNSLIVSAIAGNITKVNIIIDFVLFKPRPRNVQLICVFWDTNSQKYSEEGCTWQGPSNEARCVCEHLSSFTILLSKEPLTVPGIEYVTYTALSVSVLSLIITLVIELIVWKDVVKTSTLYLRHTAHVNISLCLLIGDLCFLTSTSHPKLVSDLWCQTTAVIMHFCFLAMFFWMFCLSATLLHQAVFLFHKVSKKNYLRFSMVIGYVTPLLIVFITFLTNNGGAEGEYYSRETCWLVYKGLMEGSIFTFIIPVGAIVFINVFAMLVVIMKLISHHSEIQQKSDISPEKEREAAKIVLRSVILLTPIFGVTWIFGFAIFILDLTSGPIGYAVSYIFTILNGFQGLFILLTTCMGDRMTREALRKHLKKEVPVSSVTESTTKSETTWKK